MSKFIKILCLIAAIAILIVSYLGESNTLSYILLSIFFYSTFFIYILIQLDVVTITTNETFKSNLKIVNSIRKKMFTYIKQLFCKHDYEQIDFTPDPIPREGEICNSIRLHRCKKCGKEQLLGSGWYS